MRGKVAAALILALTLGCGAAQAGPLVLDPQAMRQLANEALQQGYAEQALAYAEALLARDPADTTALIIKARALRALGRYAESEAMARQAWALAKDDPARYGAAMTLAQALSLQDHRTLAQVWLRTAVEFAPNERAKAKAISDFAYVRSQNPLNLRFDLAIQPSDNVNNGTFPQIIIVPGLPPASPEVALSGVTGTLGFSGHYRLSQTQTKLTDLTFAAEQQVVWLSSDAPLLVPGAENGDYAFAMVEGGLSQRAVGPKGAIVTTSATFGHNWFANKNFSDYLTLNLGGEQAIAPNAIGFANLSVGRVERADYAVDSTTSGGVTFGETLRLKTGDSLRLSLGAGQTWSQNENLGHHDLSATLDWTHAKPVQGMAISGSIEVKDQEYPTFFVPGFPIGRQDLRLSASLSAELTQVEYMGFSPLISVSWAKTSSSFSPYDTETAEIGLTMKSQF